MVWVARHYYHVDSFEGHPEINIWGVEGCAGRGYITESTYSTEEEAKKRVKYLSNNQWNEEATKVVPSLL